MTPFEFYLITRLDVLSHVVAILMIGGIVGAVVGVIGFIGSHCDSSIREETRKFWRKYAIVAAVTSMLISGVFVVTPTTNQVFMAIAAPHVINNTDLRDTLGEMPKATKQTLELVNQYLTKKLAEAAE